MGIFKDFNYTVIHFSKVIGSKVILESSGRLGVISDLFVDYEEVYPKVLALQLKQNNQFFYVQWEDVIHFNYGKIIIKKDTPLRRSRTYPKVVNQKVVTSLLASQFRGEAVEYPPIGKVILDRQIVDISGKKVVRVNDIHLIKVGPGLKVTHAAIGIRSILRRLDLEPFVDFAVKIFNKNAKYLKSDVLIDWKYVHAIPDKSIQKNVTLSLDNKQIKNLHPADLADILEDLDGNSRELLFSNLHPELQAQTLSEIEEETLKVIINRESPEDLAQIIENMGPDEAADVLNEIGKKKAFAIISNIKDQETKEEIRELLEYEEDEAGGLMSTEVFQVLPETRKSEILDIIQKEHNDIESIFDIYIIDNDEKLLGTCSLTKILAEKEDLMIKEVMNSHDIKSLTPHTPWKEVASFMSKYNLINVPIIDNHNELLGIVSVDDVLPWLLDEK